MAGAAPPRAEPALRASGIVKRFGRVVALAGVDIEVAAGERIAVIGPNGAGKTTLLAILAGTLAPDAGTVSVAGGRLGWVPQRPAVYSKLSVAENLRLFARLEGVPDVSDAVARMLEQTGLSERAHDEVGRLSGGNRQRVNVAVGVLADPHALLLDEPSAALDPRQRERLWEFIERLRARGTTVVFTTHHLAEAEHHSDRVIVLADGELLFSGTVAELEAESGGGGIDFEGAFVRFLRERGH